MPVSRHGVDGDRTDVVCGYLHSQDPLFDPDLRVFPPVFVVRPPDGPAANWVRANVAYALERSGVATDGPSIVMSRLPELLLIEVLQLHLASAPAAGEGCTTRKKRSAAPSSAATASRRPRGAQPIPCADRQLEYPVCAAELAGMVFPQSACQAGPLAAAMPVLNWVQPLTAVLLGTTVLNETPRTSPRSASAHSARSQ